MSQRRKIKQQLLQLAEIRNIMDAMKNLAVVEIHKSATGLENQQQMVTDLEQMAADFLGFYPYSFPHDGDQANIWVLFGSERGFCGDFNTTIIEMLGLQRKSSIDNQALLIPVGSKICQRLEHDPEVSCFISGPDVVEEVAPVLGNIVNHISQLQRQFNTCNIYVLFHQTETSMPACKQLIPPFKQYLDAPARFNSPPLLNIPLADLFSGLVDHYLYTALHQIACMSMMAENYKRIQHITGALQQLDERTEQLSRSYHIHRQEEITEEIEVILLHTPVQFPFV
jgi:F-type H+-transporting ATPase subunit gamma